MSISSNDLIHITLSLISELFGILFVMYVCKSRSQKRRSDMDKLFSVIREMAVRKLYSRRVRKAAKVLQKTDGFEELLAYELSEPDLRRMLTAYSQFHPDHVSIIVDDDGYHFHSHNQGGELL